MSGQKKKLLKDNPQPAAKTIDLFSVGILNSLSSHICVVNNEGEIIAINRAWAQYGAENGGEPQALNEGSNYFDVCQRAVDSDGVEPAAAAIAGIRQVLTGQAGQFEMEYDCHSPDEKRWFLMRVSPMQFRGSKAVISHIDITEKKLAEEELSTLHTINQNIGQAISLDSLTQRILEQISLLLKPDICLVFLREGDTLRLQGCWPERTTVLTDEKHIHRIGECLCGLSVSSGEPVFSANIHEDSRCVHPECKAAGIVSFAALPLIRKVRVIGTIGLASLTPRDFAQNRRFLETVATDIAVVLENSLLFEQVSNSAAALERQLASRQELEAQLVQTQKMDAIGTLAGGIAHDFNNVLAIIKGNVDLLQTGRLSPEAVNEKIANINATVDRATDLVRQILSFSRQRSLTAEAIDLNLAINENIKFLRSTIPTTVEILKDLNPGPLTILADNTQLQQVFINLCNNAVQAMGNKGLLKISLDELTLPPDQRPRASQGAAGRFAKVSVADSGCGMDKDTLEKIFDPFFTTKDVSSGTGLGLSVVHGIVRAHDGFIRVDSKPGAGSTFHLFFPLYAGADNRAEETQSNALPRGEERILLVDDEDYLVQLGAEMLEYLGYRVTSATSSSEALELFQRDPHAFDLVFTDQTMPQLTGVELAAAVAQIRPGIPVILCSGYSSVVSEQNLEDTGIAKFCMKPLSLEQIAAATREVLDSQSNL